jgi:hypothetical protein
LVELSVADPVARWEALGFTVGDGARVELGGVTVRLGFAGRGIIGWSIAGAAAGADIDGLATANAAAPREPTAVVHPNGAVAIDHVVVVTPDFDRTARELEAAGMRLKRVRDAGGFRQGFRRLGPAILELVEAPGQDADGPARFWGLVVIVEDLDALGRRLGDLLGDATAAVQPGRRIATLRKEAGLSPHVAFMTPE